MPATNYPRADCTAIIPAFTPSHAGIITAVGNLDSAIETLRNGSLEFKKLRLEQQAVPITISSAGAITVTYTWHLIYTEAWVNLTTINGGNAGDIIVLERATNSAAIRVGDYLLEEDGQKVWLLHQTSGWVVLGSSGRLVTASFKAYRTTTQQALAASTSTQVQFNATVWNHKNIANNDSYATGSYNYFTDQAGMYLHDVQLTIATAIPLGTYLILYFQKNSATIAQVTLRGDGNVDRTIRLCVKDYASGGNDSYQVRAQQNDVGTHYIQIGADKTFWTATRLHRFN